MISACRFMMVGLSLLVAIAETTPVVAQDQPSSDGGQTADQRWAIHGQATFVAQGVTGFASPYEGPNSLKPRDVRETMDATLFVGVRAWAGAEIWANPEVDQGFGLSNTLGVAAFPSAEAYKIGQSSPYVRLQRLFLRQTINLSAGRDAVDGSANQLASAVSAHRLVFTLGKFSVADIFDTNRYAHDPRGDFLNWALVDGGAFDYAAQAWGYSYGAAAEYYRHQWTVRLGLFNLSKVSNGEALETDFSQNQVNAELEHRHTLWGRQGAVRLTVFRSHGRFARYSDALGVANVTGEAPDLDPVRRLMTRWGGIVNIEQEATSALGFFARGSAASGDIAPYDFTDIDRSISIGGSLKGAGWRRKQDTVGLACVVNGISKEHKDFLAAGGTGLLVGDGQLPHPGREKVVEAYYDWQPVQGINLTADYQFVANPAYNRDRGPANIFAVRVHGAF